MGLLFSSGKRDFCDDRLPCGALHGPAKYERAKNSPRSWAARLQPLSLLNPRSPYPCRWSCVPPHIACDCLICKQMTRRSNIRVRGLAGAQGSLWGWRRWFGRVGNVGRNALDVDRKQVGRNKNMGLGNLGDLSNLDLGQLQQYLPNLNFPASKDEVISEVQNNGAPQDVIDQIRNSSTDTFNNAEEVLETVRGK